MVGSTEYIIKALDAAPAGSAWAVGTELNLVRRLAVAHPDKQIMFLDRTVCYCSTDRKSTRLNSSHANISYAVFCLKKKHNKITAVHTYPRRKRAVGGTMSLQTNSRMP